MLDKIRTLEIAAQPLAPTAATREAWATAVQAYADNFIEGLDTEFITYWDTPSRGDAPFDTQLPAHGQPIEEVLAALRKTVDSIGLNPASGGHLGYIPGGGLYSGALGDFLAAVTNRYAGLYFGGPGAVRLENALLKWLADVMHYPAGTVGNLTSGGSIANLIAITTARDAQGITSQRVPKAVIYLTAQVHHCVHKAIRIAGLAEATVRTVPLDGHFRMNVNALAELLAADKAAGLQPFLIIASAGTTDTGAVDPLDAIADLAQAYQVWFHVDGAYGGLFMLTPEARVVLQGIERSDSVVIDPHKGLFLSYGLGAVLVKNAKAVLHSHYYRANYLQDADLMDDEYSPADLSPELTKHFRGLRMWLSLQLVGVAPFQAALSEKIWLCRYFYEEIQKMGFEVGPYPDLSVMIYRYVPATGDANAFNERLVAYVREDGSVFLSSTTIDGVYWIRLAVLSFRTHLATIDTCLRVLRAGIAHVQSLF